MTPTCEQPAGFIAAGYGALFTLGFAGSLHCVGMCAPLSCLMGGSKGQGLGLYHLARLVSYALLGALLWKLGAPLRLSLSWPWLLALLSLPLAWYALKGSIALPQSLARLHLQAAAALKGVPPWQRSLGLGLLTPLLPCGLLYAAAGFSLSAPDALTASLWMLSFALGTLPLLALSQGGYRLALRLNNPVVIPFLRRAFAGVAALAVLLFALRGHG